jgi:hypothetical protein
MGGAAGHMKHPFETYDILNGKDLLAKFNMLAKVLSENNPTIKLDGANTSFKVVNNTFENLEFALDRGTQQKEDIAGITLSNMRERFLNQIDLKVIECDDPRYVGLEFAKRIDWFIKNTDAGDTINVGDEINTTKRFTLNRIKMPFMKVIVTNIREHGMVGTTNTQLTLLNKVFEVYPKEAKKCLQIMGMVDAKGVAIPESFLINTEFVDETEAGGAANVITYGLDQPSKFLAFHGLIEIRPTEKGRGDFISNYPTYTINQGQVGKALNLLTSLIEKANEGSGWEFFDASRYRAELPQDVSEINIESALSQNISIKITPDNEETKTIKQWLEDSRVITPPRKDPERPSKGYQSFIIGGTKNQPVSKALYNNLINSASGNSGPLSLEELAPGNPELQSYIMTGAIYYHSTKIVGRDIKRQMTNLSGLGMQSLVTVYDQGGNPTEHGHEGIAIQHEALGIDKDTGYPYIIKVVGDFIVTGAMGRFAVDRSSTPTITESYLRRLIKESLRRIILR